MRFYNQFLYILAILSVMLACGCVERRLTIVTQPSEATVWLNDEEVGITPVTVNFNWYGDYRIRIEKPGYEILNTHKKLSRPLHDYMPFDFITECLWPGKITDSYTWTFEMNPYQAVSAQDLIKEAQQSEASFEQEIDYAKQQVEESITGKKADNKKQ